MMFYFGFSDWFFWFCFCVYGCFDWFLKCFYLAWVWVLTSWVHGPSIPWTWKRNFDRKNSPKTSNHQNFWISNFTLERKNCNNFKSLKLRLCFILYILLQHLFSHISTFLLDDELQKMKIRNENRDARNCLFLLGFFCWRVGIGMFDWSSFL
jgi:hypothetical protein